MFAMSKLSFCTVIRIYLIMQVHPDKKKVSSRFNFFFFQHFNISKLCFNWFLLGFCPLDQDPWIPSHIFADPDTDPGSQNITDPDIDK